MKDENCDHGRKCIVGERKSGSVSLHHGNARTFVFVFFGEASDKRGIVFEAGHSAGAAQQFIGGGAWACSDFQHVITERVTGDDPREQLAFSDQTPKRGTAKPVFKEIHERGQSGEVPLM